MRKEVQKIICYVILLGMTLCLSACTENAGACLPRALSDIIEAKFAIIKKKLGRIMFKHSVETNITNHILAADTDMDQQTYEHLRNRSVREVLETNGEITFLDNLKFQKSV